MSNNDESKLLKMKKILQMNITMPNMYPKNNVTKLLIPWKLINVQRSLFIKGKSLFIIYFWQLFSEEEIVFVFYS